MGYMCRKIWCSYAWKYTQFTSHKNNITKEDIYILTQFYLIVCIHTIVYTQKLEETTLTIAQLWVTGVLYCAFLNMCYFYKHETKAFI